METIRLLLAIAANNKWEVHHLDVKSAFLHGDLKEEVEVATKFNTRRRKGLPHEIFYYGESPISWSTQKQATVALSSCESEFIAATAAATQALWLKRGGRAPSSPPTGSVAEDKRKPTHESVFSTKTHNSSGNPRILAQKDQGVRGYEHIKEKKSEHHRLPQPVDKPPDNKSQKKQLSKRDADKENNTLNLHSKQKERRSNITKGQLDRYLQIVASIEQYSDLKEMTLEEAVGRLKTYEERIKFKKGKQVDNHDKLMFTTTMNTGKNILEEEDGKNLDSHKVETMRTLRKRGKKKTLIEVIIEITSRNQIMILVNYDAMNARN
ncbi:zinc finger, CCHC-type containing protein [Tanacetum coccineum]